MFIRDIDIYADESIVDNVPSGFVQRFHRETCCITGLYLTFISRKIVTLDTKKILITFNEISAGVPSVKQLIDVAELRWAFCFSDYLNANEYEKKTLIIKALQAALIWLAENRKWDQSFFEESYRQCFDRRLDYEGWSKKSWPHPNRKFKAKIFFTFGLSAVELFVCIFDKGNREIGRKLLGSTHPETGIHQALLKDAVWRKDRKFRLMLGPASFHLPKFWEVDLSDILKT